MLKVKNINITFDKPIIESSSIVIKNGEITCIIGESGSGKTTLLYILGLISSQKDYKYYLDDKNISINNDILKSEVRKHRIGYVFQDNNLIENLTVEHNILLASRIAGVSLSGNELIALLKYVGIENLGDKYPSQLSGGERQRVAIAVALSKKPEIIIADEPTAALDATNTKTVFDIFSKIAYEQDKMVVIATHDEQIYGKADTVFEIKDKIINPFKLSNGNTNQGDTKKKNLLVQPEKRKDIDFIFLLSYIRNISKKHNIAQKIMLLFCAIAVSFFTLSSNLGEGLIKQQNKFIENISSKELFLVNATLPTEEIRDFDLFLSIDREKINKIENVSEVETVFPYFEFISSGFYKDEIVETNKIYTKGKEYVFNEKALSSKQTRYICSPYFSDEFMDKRCIVLDKHFKNEYPVYITKQLAEVLEIDWLNDTNISFDIFVPSKQLVSTGTNEDEEYKTDVDIHNKKHLSLSIRGILDENYTNTKSNMGQNIIYMPYAVMEKILQECKAKEINDNVSEKEKIWEPSALVILAKNYDLVSIIKEKVGNVDGNFKIDSPFQNIAEIKSNLYSLQKISSTLAVIVLLIIIVLMSIIYINHTIHRKYEFAILRANGINKAELVKLIFIQGCIQIVKVFFLACIFLIVAKVIVNELLFVAPIIGITYTSLLLMLAVTIVSVLIPTLITLLEINKYNPDAIMRN